MFLLALLLQQSATPSVDTTLHSGRAGHTTVAPPRLTGEIVLDGKLDEPQWQVAARLGGFSQLLPVDGVAAADTTEIRVWYSTTALYIGVHAIDRSGTIRATLATRDQIFNDDNVQIYLSTFNDGRQATVFAVNPFGVQADGALNESGAVSCGYSNCAAVTRQQPNLSPDFVWNSKGIVTPDGYDVEIRIPFKSIRFQSGKVQTWGINILRVVQRTGQQETWTATRMGASSFLTQSGQLTGLTGIDAGHTLDLVPTVTTTDNAGPTGADGHWDSHAGRPQLGGDLAYGITPNLTLHATAHPDFSQVESDVTQFQFDPRQALFYPEKRPFFLDGIEQFDAPANLIYTRNIVQPIFAGKVTGKVGDNQIGALAAIDERGASAYGDNPVFGILRASHDLGPGSRVGVTWTEQHDGPETNRVLAADSRVVFGGINAVAVSGALAHDDADGIVHNAPLWAASYRRNGRNFRMNYSVSGIADSFVTRSGFVSQTGVANAQLSNSYTWLRPAGRLQSLTGEVVLGGFWRYDAFVHGGSILNRQLHFNLNSAFRGGWAAGLGYYHESFGYDSTIYTQYRIRQPDGSFTPFTGNQMRLPNNDYVFSANTPTWKHFDFGAFVLAGLDDENYKEWASGRIVIANLNMDIRPTDHLRLNVAYNDSRDYRPSDGSRVSLQDVIVGTLEYQISRAFQLRVIPQYSIDARDSLHDDSRTNLPLYIVGVDGVPVRAAAYDHRALQANFLFTYLPNPGTVIYVGYGSVSQRPDYFGAAQLGEVQRSLFVKLSYLFRMRG
ncbi:MAG TPA: DUF5916 domain-containing protein [Gemmatimonadales bacterium]|jgi:hypothetical protein